MALIALYTMLLTCGLTLQRIACAGSSFLSQLPSAGLPAVTEEPAAAHDIADLDGGKSTDGTDQDVPAEPAAQSSRVTADRRDLEAVIAEAVSVAAVASPSREALTRPPPRGATARSTPPSRARRRCPGEASECAVFGRGLLCVATLMIHQAI